MTVALVLGGARSMWADIEAALSLGEFDGVVGCNDAAAVWPGRIDAAVSLHVEKWPHWLARRARSGFPPIGAVIGHLEAQASQPPVSEGIDCYTEFRFEGQTTVGSSGLFALKVALTDLAFDRAVLCGIPMTADPHFNNDEPWSEAAGYRSGWTEALPHIAKRARSMSGWTSELLGRPDAEWIGGL